MKLIKLSVLRNQSIIVTNYSILRFNFPISIDSNYISNIVRRSLLRDILLYNLKSYRKSVDVELIFSYRNK